MKKTVALAVVFSLVAGFAKADSRAPQVHLVGVQNAGMLRDGFGPPVTEELVRLYYTVTGLSGPIAATRVRVSSVQDDQKYSVSCSSGSTFYAMSVGGGPQVSQQPRRGEIMLVLPTKAPVTLSEITGTVEVVVPSLDPHCTVQIALGKIRSETPIDAPAIRELGLTLTADYGDDSVRPGPALPILPPNESLYLAKEVPPPPPRARLVDRGELALTFRKSADRFVSIQFVAPDGTALPYFDQGFFGTAYRYRLRTVNDSATAVVTLATDKSIVSIPFSFSNVPLPSADSLKEVPLP